MIDTGLGVSNIKNIVDDLTTLPVMVVTTHVHWDNIGGHRYFENKEMPPRGSAPFWRHKGYAMVTQAAKVSL